MTRRASPCPAHDADAVTAADRAAFYRSCTTGGRPARPERMDPEPPPLAIHPLPDQQVPGDDLGPDRARADLDHVDRRVAVDDLVERVVIGTVLGAAVFNALRLLAHVDASARLFGQDRAADAERKAPATSADTP